MSNLFETGIRPAVDAYLTQEAAKKRDYGEYWSASSAGYCMRKVIFDRLGVEPTSEDARKTRVFEAGHIFHEWLQRVTKDSGLSIASEVELIDEELHIKGHFDDLVMVDGNLMLYDYKTQNSRAFQWQKKNGNKLSHYHRLQIGTYMYMWRKPSVWLPKNDWLLMKDKLKEARILKISKDDLCMSEDQLLWSTQLEKDVVNYWSTLNGYWTSKKMPKCTCADFEGGFLAKPAYNPYYFNDEPCSMEWLKMWQEKKNAAL